MGTANYSGRPLTRNYMNPPPGRECKFCKNNGEMSSMYRSHVLRSPDTGFLVCPVLRAHVCEVCGATGDYGHTRYLFFFKVGEYHSFPLRVVKTIISGMIESLF